jgi:hypothetical protein
MRLLRTIATLRVVDREAASVIGPFGSATRANTRLHTLVRAGLLTRLAVGTSAGGHKYLYALTRQGAHVADVPYRPAPWTRDTLLAGSIGLEHQLRLNALYLLLMHQPHPHDKTQVQTWRTFAQPLPQSTGLVPDAYFELETAAGVRAWFVEIDRGTESQRVWKRKVERYVQFAMSEAFATFSSAGQFGVLVIAPSDRRVKSLRHSIARTTTKLFWLAAYHTLTPEGFWSASWWRPTGDSLHTLIPQDTSCATAPTVSA